MKTKNSSPKEAVIIRIRNSLQLFPNLVGVGFAVEIGMLFVSAERFAAGHKDDFIRIGVFADVMTAVGAHIKIGARLVGVITKLMCTAFASLEKEDVSLCDRFKPCGSTQSRRSGKYHKQFFSVAVKMVRSIILSRIEPPQIEIQVLRFYVFLFARNVCELNPSILPGLGWKSRSSLRMIVAIYYIFNLLLLYNPCLEFRRSILADVNRFGCLYIQFH